MHGDKKAATGSVKEPDKNGGVKKTPFKRSGLSQDLKEQRDQGTLGKKKRVSQSLKWHSQSIVINRGG